MVLGDCSAYINIGWLWMTRRPCRTFYGHITISLSHVGGCNVLQRLEYHEGVRSARLRIAISCLWAASCPSPSPRPVAGKVEAFRPWSLGATQPPAALHR